MRKITTKRKIIALIISLSFGFCSSILLTLLLTNIFPDIKIISFGFLWPIFILIAYFVLSLFSYFKKEKNKIYFYYNYDPIFNTIKISNCKEKKFETYLEAPYLTTIQPKVFVRVKSKELSLFFGLPTTMYNVECAIFKYKNTKIIVETSSSVECTPGFCWWTRVALYCTDELIDLLEQFCETSDKNDKLMVLFISSNSNYRETFSKNRLDVNFKDIIEFYKSLNCDSAFCGLSCLIDENKLDGKILL